MDEFSSLPLLILPRGRDIIQFMGLYGHTVAERLRNIAGQLPLFVHAQARKPWMAFAAKPARMPLSAYARAVYADLSPYTLVALGYRRQLPGSDLGWMDPHFRLSRVLRKAGFGHPPLVGLPVALAIGCAQLGLGLMRRVRAV